MFRAERVIARPFQGGTILSCFVLIVGDHETFNPLAFKEPIHNLRYVSEGDTTVKKMIGFD